MADDNVCEVDTRRLTQLCADIEKRVEFPPGPLVVSLSGGADSAAVAWLAIRADSQCRAIHVNHSLPYSFRMAAAARAVARRLGMDLTEASIDTAPDTSEQALRAARYQALADFSRADELVMIGHTADDQAETVLMNLLRGAGLYGMVGIPAHRGRFYRPLLGVWRSETRELATLAGLPWEDDPQNDDPTYLRNRIRRRLIPQLEAEYQPRLREGLVRLSALAGTDVAYLEEVAARIPLRTSPTGWVEASCDRLVELSPAISSRVIRRALRMVREPYAGTGAEVQRILDVVHRRASRAQLAGGVRVFRSGDRLLFAKGN